MTSKLRRAILGDEIEEKEKEPPIPKDWKLIGFFGPGSMAGDLNLAAVGIDLDKSKLLRKIVTDWLLDNNPIKVMTEKMKELASHASEEMQPEQFISNVRSYLQERKVPSDLIDQVIQNYETSERTDSQKGRRRKQTQTDETSPQP